jgi:hypothetical protein
MAHLHNFAKQSGIVMGQIGQKVKQVAEIAHGVKAIWDVGSFLKNAIVPALEVAAVVL